MAIINPTQGWPWIPRAALLVVSLVVDVRVDISLLAVVVDSVAVEGGVVVVVGAGGGVVVASVIVVLVVFSVVFLDFVAIVVAAENSIGIFASRCIILHLDITSNHNGTNVS